MHKARLLLEESVIETVETTSGGRAYSYWRTDGFFYGSRFESDNPGLSHEPPSVIMGAAVNQMPQGLGQFQRPGASL